jgi:DNA-directed RNA polymerase alpha subunit
VKTVTSKKREKDFPRLAAPARRALERAGVQTLADLAKFSEEEVEQWHGIGPRALNELRQALHAHSLAFAGKQIKEA